LEVNKLSTHFHTERGRLQALREMNFHVNKGEILALVGESGSGKSVTVQSILRLFDEKHLVEYSGEVKFKNQDLLKLSTSEMEKIRGNKISMIFQDPLTALNPLMEVGDQIAETLILHRPEMSKKQRYDRVIELLNLVGIPRPEFVYEQYPHELSGGMRQRVVIAIAIANRPELLIADEPTTALDVTIQAQILDLIRELKQNMDAGVILITHDLGVVAEMADRVAVMYAGQIVEIAEVHKLFEKPLHPYTRSLLNSVPTEGQDQLHVIQGIVPSLKNLPRKGCRFAARIPWVDESAHEENPVLHEVSPGHFVRCTCHSQFYFPDERKEDQTNGVS